MVKKMKKWSDHHQKLTSSRVTLIVRRTRLSTVSDRAFPVAAPRIWNSLPQHVTSARSLAIFHSRLKTHLFKRCFPWLHRSLVVPEKWHVITDTYLLPPHVTSAPSLPVFRSRLKTHLFRRCFPWLHLLFFVVPVKWLVIIAHVNRSFYLLTYSRQTKWCFQPLEQNAAFMHMYKWCMYVLWSRPELIAPL